MKLTRIEKLSWIGCPWLFGVVLLITGLVLPSEGPLLKALSIGLAFLLLGLYGTNSLLAKLIEKETT